MSDQPRTVGFVSLGCPKNLVDSEVMIGLVREAGHHVTPDAAEADVLVVNTCAFIDAAKQESIDAILELAEHKRAGRCRRLVVTGCLAERYRDELRAEIPEIDVTLGTGEVPAILSAIDGAGAASTPPHGGASGPRPSGPVAPDPSTAASAAPARLHRRPLAGAVRRPLPDYLYEADTPRTLTTAPHLAYVKVAEGCDYACSFCIIPTLRGHYRSRTSDSVVTEARTLVERGVKEIVLISQDTTFYGNDRGERDGLARLLRELDRVDGLEWIRLLYLYPTTITDAAIDAMAECDSVCRYVDLPLQHASTDVLRRMRRPGDRRRYETLLDDIRRRVPGVALRTTFIVGYPGETEAEFAELESFVGDLGFDHVGVFTYSHEEGTSAHRLDDDVPARVKRSRRDRLMRTQRAIVGRAQAARVGARERVLIDGPVPGQALAWQGRLEGQAPEIDPVVYLSALDPERHTAGTFLDARITGARDYDLVAEPVPEPYETPGSTPRSLP